RPVHDQRRNIRRCLNRRQLAATALNGLARPRLLPIATLVRAASRPHLRSRPAERAQLDAALCRFPAPKLSRRRALCRDEDAVRPRAGYVFTTLPDATEPMMAWSQAADMPRRDHPIGFSLAQVSRKPIVLLKTNLLSFESGSRQK